MIQFSRYNITKRNEFFYRVCAFSDIRMKFHNCCNQSNFQTSFHCFIYHFSAMPILIHYNAHRKLFYIWLIISTTSIKASVSPDTARSIVFVFSFCLLPKMLFLAFWLKNSFWFFLFLIYLCMHLHHLPDILQRYISVILHRAFRHQDGFSNLLIRHIRKKTKNYNFQSFLRQ